MKIKNSFKVMVFLTLLSGLFIPAIPAHAEAGILLPSFSDFVAAVTNGNAGVVRGVYVPDVMNYRVVQQLADNPGYVSPVEGVVTQFSMAAQYGTIGLLAHNFLAGENFTNLYLGQEVRIIYGDGTISSYEVNSINRYQALDPGNSASGFIDLKTGTTYSALAMFKMYYQGGNHVTFQTCILRDGNSSWGRLFITATPSAPIPVIETPTYILDPFLNSDVATSTYISHLQSIRDITIPTYISHPLSRRK